MGIYVCLIYINTYMYFYLCVNIVISSVQLSQTVSLLCMEDSVMAFLFVFSPNVICFIDQTP